MYLKRLESVGFKSFAERINVEFVPGVTAVVGPNGSGKSNITDAIRWVLGEPSAKSLRGSKMEDVIFQGSDSRRSLNIAEVTLTMDNADHELPLDYEEISVTRRVYRSGESEFYLNRQACRLKDIIDLFMDSGLGKEAFSIISQGKVEEILRSKADERRTVFEEAAGILKYKQRKRKAGYKLEETEENLNRVKDILSEIEQQIGPLKKQSDTAEEYLRQKENLKREEVSLLVTEIEQLYDDWQNLLKELENDNEEATALNTMIQQRQAELEKEEQALKQMDDSIEHLQEELLTLTQELEHTEGKKRVLKERLRHFTENKTKLETEQATLQTRLHNVQHDWDKEKEVLTTLESQKQRTQERIDKLEKKQQTTEQDITEQMEELKTEYIELLNKQAAKRNEKQSIESRIEQLTAKKDHSEKAQTELQTKRDQLEQSLAEADQQVKDLKKERDEQAREINHQKVRIAEKRDHYQEEQEKLNKGYQSMEKLKSQEEMLEGLKEDFQGFFHGVKSILKARNEKKLTHIHGAIIELMDVPSNYVTAIETVLGGQSQHIVVDDEASARSAIQWLKKTNKGRATFLPLSTIRPRFVKQNILARVEKHQGFIGIASTMVASHETYKPAIEHLMGHVLIATTLKDANEIASLGQYNNRVVTLEGEIINPSGSMSGGAKKKVNQSLFTREKDLKAVKNKRESYEQRIHQLEQKLYERDHEINDMEKDRSSLEDKMENTEQVLQTAHNHYREYEMELQSVKSNESLYTKENNQFNADFENLRSKKQTLERELTALEEQLNEKNERMDSLSNQEATFKEEQEQTEQSLHQCRVTLAEQNERIRSQKEKTTSLGEQVEELQKQYADGQKQWHELMQTYADEQTESEMDEAIEAKKEDKEKMSVRLQDMRNNRIEKNQKIHDEEREVKEETKKYQHFLQTIQEKEVRSNRLDVALENRLTQLESDYTLTYEKAKNVYEKVADPETVKQEVQNMKQAIDRLGTVNIGAIDEYKRVYERYSFLEEQKADLEEAKQTLYTVIGEMNDEMRVRFESTFTQIQETFSLVFKELFGGGKAELQLTDPNNILDTGIDMIAQPPGKKLQHLGLLSGGERALTAIALLFAILRVRSVPFVVLDEAEAALDEANVVRFRDYVKMYSEHTQFIIITHQKGTMEAADVLYGMTMQESGVSRLVSVRLEESKKLVNT